MQTSNCPLQFIRIIFTSKNALASGVCLNCAISVWQTLPMNRLKLVVLTIAALFAMPTFLTFLGDGQKADVQQRVNHSSEENDETTLRSWHQYIEQVNTCNQADLKVVPVNGQGSPQNNDTAMKSHPHAAEQANAKTHFRFGDMYAFGDGVLQDHDKAAKWYQVGRKQGDEDADTDHDILETERFTVGLDCYEYGEFRVAFDEWETLARHGFSFNKARAQFRLGEMLESGQGVKQDFVLAYLWFNTAASQSHEEAASRRDMIVKRMTPSQLEAAQNIGR
jgi:TPR repeat protein